MDPVSWLQNGIRSGIGPDAALYVLIAIGINLHYGYTGLRNFGQVAFALVGGYGVAISVATWGLPLWLGIIIALASSVVLALLLGIPTLRLRADYFAIVTIAVGEILRIAARSGGSTDLTGGPYGLRSGEISEGFFRFNPLPDGRIGWGQLSYASNDLYTALVGWLFVGLITLLLARLVRSPWGRVLRSIREDEDVARSLGKNVFAYKLQSLVLGGLCGAVAGILMAMQTSGVNADGFQTSITFYAYAIVILGGAATLVGPVVGGIIFWFLFASFDSFLRDMDAHNNLPGFLSGSETIGATRDVLVGIGLMLLLVFRPQGIFGDRKEASLSD